ncbi:MAG: outer membrane protein assembly factor BamA [Acidobacteriaceae bacterium]
MLVLLLAPVVPGTPILAQQEEAGATAAAGQQKIVEIRVIGARRIPRETVLARMFSRVGEPFDPLTVERDFNSLWNTGYFEDVRIEKEDTPQGVILDVYVREKPTIRDITYPGLSSVTQSDLLDRFKKEKVGLSVESQYDPARIAHAVTVIKEMLAEHGHQFAIVRPEIKDIPPASVQLIFRIKEGPTVKVGKISFSGNSHVGSRTLREAMRNLRPVGIPHSIIFENLFARTYDASKLEEDSERVRLAYEDRGYLRAAVGEPQTHIRNESGLSLFTFRPRKGKRIDIHMNIEEGERYRLAAIKFTGNTGRANPRALRAIFNIKDGSVFNATAFRKGLDNLRKAYSQDGYIDFSAIPTPAFDAANHTVTWTVDCDEGKQFTVSRIEFQGNTVTRDFVIRRELLLQEGQVYNSHLWELSLLRLNQLQYFNELRVDQDSETHQNTEAGTVDLLLKVQEKGKNSIGLNGGVSGLSGAFLGLNYQTNNFLGLGETLSVQANAGSLNRQLLFSFNEPYVRNRPLNLGFQVFDSKTDYNASKSYSLTGTSANQGSAISSLLQNYNQGRKGFTLSASYPVRRFSLFGFSRVGATYSWDSSTVRAFSQASSNLFQILAFRSGIQGQNALEGIITSAAMFSYNSSNIDSNYLPHSGQSLAATVKFAGIWGSVRFVQPVVEYKRFSPMKGFWFNKQGRNTLGMRLQAVYIRGFSGDVAPPFDRPSAGGEQDIRGFDVRTITPYGFVPTRVQYALTNPDGSTVPRDPTNPTLGPIEVPLPVYGIATIGGDTNFTGNLQYMIPIYGRTVGFNLFDDFGMDMAVSTSQLRQSPEGIDALNSPLYGCPNYVNGTCQGGQQIRFSPTINPIPGTNYVPRDSAGGELDVMMPIINAPFRIYYAVNPLKLFTSFTRQNLITRNMFPAGGAGDYSYAQAEQLYNGTYILREPSKTFRLTVATTF